MKKLRVNISIYNEIREKAKEMAKEDRRYGISSLIEYLIVKEYNERKKKKENE